MFRRARHQNGSLQRVKRKSGDVVWVFRWYETQIDGSKKYRKAVVGTVDDYKTEAEAQNAVDALRLTINEQTPRQQLREISFETLVEHYRQHEMPDIYYKGKQLPESLPRTRTENPTRRRTPIRAISRSGFCRDGSHTGYRTSNLCKSSSG